jgi:hypothetical protein
MQDKQNEPVVHESWIMNHGSCIMDLASCIMDRKRKMIRTMKSIGRYLSFAVIVIVFLSGCAQKGPILLTIGYQAPVDTAGTASPIVVGVTPLIDVRALGEQPSVLGKRTIPSGMQNDLVVQSTVAAIATASLKSALARRGITVKDVAAWDLTADGVPAEGPALVLGGEIKEFWLESSPSTFNTHLKASIRLKIVAGDPAEKKVIRTLNVSSNLDQDVFYSRERLEAVFSEALSSAIDQIFKDEELKKRLQ